MPFAGRTQEQLPFRRSATAPTLEVCERPPLVPPPAGASCRVYDLYDNHWALGPADAAGQRPLLLLPAQAPDRWIAAATPLPPLDWHSLVADEFGLLWAIAPTRALRLDPRHPEAGWRDLTPELDHTDRITAAGISPGGALLLALGRGALVELDHTDRTLLQRTAAPPGIVRLGADRDGRTWVRDAHGWWVRDALPGCWQQHWELIARLPGCNHDLAGDSLGDSFVLAGGLTAGWGFPARPHVFDTVQRLSAETLRWEAIGRLSHPRLYCGVTVVGREVWVIGGRRLDPTTGALLSLDTVEILDTRSGTLRPGPPLPVALGMPVSARLGTRGSERIYVAGGDPPATAKPGAPPAGSAGLWSLAPGEAAWRREPDAPFPPGPFAATTDGNRLFVAVPALGLAAYDPTQRSWTILGGSRTPRSPEMACFHGEVWEMGGRDLTAPLSVSRYDARTLTWRDGPQLPHELAWGAAGTLGDSLIYAGGANGRSYTNATYRLRIP